MNTRRNVTAWAVTGFLLLVLYATPVQAKKPEIYTGTFSRQAVGGYDPVSYFTTGNAQRGSKQLSFEHMGARWFFISQHNLDTFIANPEAYKPQYGGYCAWATANGHTASGDPEQWKIVDGKLYLNYSAKIQNRWEQDIEGFISKADQNWPQLLD